MKFQKYLFIPILLVFVSCASKKDGTSKNSALGVKDKIMLSFKSNQKLSRGTLEQKNQLSVMFSTNFTGDVSGQGVRKGKWKNITKRFEFSPVVEDGASTETSADISDLVQKGKPFYIAFRYETPSQTPQYGYMRWQVKNIKVTQETASGSKTLMNQSKSPLDLDHKGIFEDGRCVSTTSQVVFRGNFKKGDTESPTEDWAISQHITPVGAAAPQKAGKAK